MSLGYNIKIQNEESIIENFDSYHISEITSYGPIDEYKEQSDNVKSKDIVSITATTQSLDGPMDSPWPMYCHDARHTGRSPYSTADNPGFEKWFFKLYGFVEGSAVIDNDGVIYFGSWNNNFYALYPDGSLKWTYDIGGNTKSSPAIDENGIIYVGTADGHPNYLYAIYKSNGTMKWKYHATNVFSSPAIGDDGTIIFTDSDNWNIIALYPNGTIKWAYHTNHVVHSDPAIGQDGTVYCGSHDGALYALYPNNGTLKWAFGTDDWVAKGPCIADDGTILFGSWDGYLYAVYPNGTLKWKTGGYIAGTNPVIAEDGTIYVGGEVYLTAVYPNNGSIKWQFPTPGPIRAGNPCISADGTIYVGNWNSGYILGVNSDGTEKWRRFIGPCQFAPIIGEDGTIYVGSSNQEWNGWGYILTGFLHAFNDLDPNAPTASDIDGPSNGKIDTSYDYTFISTSPLGNDVYYYVDWGDKDNTGWIGPYSSGEVVTLSHYWRDSGVFTIRAKAKDTDNLWGQWSEFSVNMKVRNRAYSNTFLLRLLEQFPLLKEVLLRLIPR